MKAKILHPASGQAEGVKKLTLYIHARIKEKEKGKNPFEKAGFAGVSFAPFGQKSKAARFGKLNKKPALYTASAPKCIGERRQNSYI